MGSVATTAYGSDPWTICTTRRDSDHPLYDHGIATRLAYRSYRPAFTPNLGCPNSLASGHPKLRRCLSCYIRTGTKGPRARHAFRPIRHRPSPEYLWSPWRYDHPCSPQLPLRTSNGPQRTIKSRPCTRRIGPQLRSKPCASSTTHRATYAASGAGVWWPPSQPLHT